jgi:activating signal cointegrator 1
VKAITVRQPWATLIAMGAKHYETRFWSTSYRGPLAIHASSAFPSEARALCVDDELFRETLNQGGYLNPTKLPLGACICFVQLTEVRPARSLSADLSERELYFGNWSPGWFGWKLENVQVFPQPFPARGRMSLWDWTPPE